MVDVLMIKADDPNVLSLYHKQKLEFHFQQKSDNDFVMFLLDTAMRVISIVQHLAPVLEAVSTAGTDQIVSNQSLSDFNLENAMSMETEPPKQISTNPQLNPSEQETNLDIETFTNNATATVFNVNTLSSALKSYAPPTSALQTALNNSAAVQAINTPSVVQNNSFNTPLNNVSASPSPRLQTIATFVSPVHKVDTVQADTNSSLVEFDKTISALQKELDSVSQSLVTESNKGNTVHIPSNNMDSSSLNNISIIKRLQENFKDTSDLVPQSGKELDLIKSIQHTIASRSKTEEMIRIKEEMEVMPNLSQTLFRQETDSRQTTERLQQLMSTLSNGPQNTITSGIITAPVFSPPSTVLSQIPNSTALSHISSLAPGTVHTTTLNQLTSAMSPATSPSLKSAMFPGPATSPVLKSAAKKNVNPLSMLHLQAHSGTVDQAAILSVLYNSERILSQASPDVKIKSASKSSPNRGTLAHKAFVAEQRHEHEHVSCHVCSKVFRGSSRAQNLKRHFNNVHLKLKPFRCVVCGMMFGLKYNLKSHMSRAHNLATGITNGLGGFLQVNRGTNADQLRYN